MTHGLTELSGITHISLRPIIIMSAHSGSVTNAATPAPGGAAGMLSRSARERGHILRIAKIITGATYSRGSLASLRRGSPDRLLHEPAFHRLVMPLDDHELEHHGSRRWAVVVQGLAVLTTAGQEAKDRDAGTLLAEAGYSEQRLARLLASRGGAVEDQVLLACRFLRGRRVTGIPTRLFEMVLAEQQPPRLDRLCFECARGYYRVVDGGGASTTAGPASP